MIWRWLRRYHNFMTEVADAIAKAINDGAREREQKRRK